jgi:hypothetical protein
VIRTRLRPVLLVALGLTVAAGCQAFLPSSADRVTIENDTTTRVTILVNGGLVHAIEAGATAQIALQGTGGPPFRIEARSPGGNVLFEMAISPEDYRNVRDGLTTMSTGAAPGCGWIEAHYGEPDPAAPVIAEAPVGRAAPGGVCP